MGITFTFSDDVAAFGFTSIDIEAGNFSLTGYDSFDNAVSFMQLNNFTGPGGVDIDWLVSSGSQNIAYAVFAGI